MTRLLTPIFTLLFLACGSPPDANLAPDAAIIEPAQPDAAAPDSTPARRCLGLLEGQSNAIGLMAAPPPALAAPYPAVPFVQHSSGAQNPPQFVDEGPLALQPRTKALAGQPAGTAGVELSLGRRLDAAAPNNWVLAKEAIDGSGLENQWIPSSGYPAVGASWFDQASDWTAGQLEAFDARLCAVVWIQGERDSNETPDYLDYLANLRAFFTPLRARFGPFLIVITKLSEQSRPGGGAPQVRAAQAAFVAETTGAILVDTDDLALRDQAHYADPSYDILGDRIGSAIVGAM